MKSPRTRGRPARVCGRQKSSASHEQLCHSTPSASGRAAHANDSRASRGRPRFGPRRRHGGRASASSTTRHTLRTAEFGASRGSSAALVVVALFAAVAFHVQLAQGQLELDRLERQTAAAHEQYQQLRLQYATAVFAGGRRRPRHRPGHGARRRRAHVPHRARRAVVYPCAGPAVHDLARGVEEGETPPWHPAVTRAWPARAGERSGAGSRGSGPRPAPYAPVRDRRARTEVHARTPSTARRTARPTRARIQPGRRVPRPQPVPRSARPRPPRRPVVAPFLRRAAHTTLLVAQEKLARHRVRSRQRQAKVRTWRPRPGATRRRLIAVLVALVLVFLAVGTRLVDRCGRHPNPDR